MKSRKTKTKKEIRKKGEMGKRRNSDATWPRQDKEPNIVPLTSIFTLHKTFFSTFNYLTNKKKFLIGLSL